MHLSGCTCEKYDKIQLRPGSHVLGPESHALSESLVCLSRFGLRTDLSSGQCRLVYSHMLLDCILVSLAYLHYMFLEYILIHYILWILLFPVRRPPAFFINFFINYLWYASSERACCRGYSRVPPGCCWSECRHAADVSTLERWICIRCHITPPEGMRDMTAVLFSMASMTTMSRSLFSAPMP